MDVAIIGVGLHPFGRFPGVSAIDMGAVAIRRALADAGVEWRDIEFAFGGSYEVDNPDAVVALLGLTGIPFTDVYNGCATAASALAMAANTIRLGEHDLGIAVGMDKHLPGAFSADPRLYACPSWYGEVGHFITTKFFGMKINKYMHDHGISARRWRRSRRRTTATGALNPNAFRRKPLSEEEILASPMLNYPLTQYMFCSPDEGAAAVVLCRAENAHRYTDTPIYLRAGRAHAPARRVRGAQSVAADPTRRRPTVYARRRPPTRWPASDPRTSTSSSSRTPTPAPRSSTWPRTASAPTASRTCCSPTVRPRSTDRCRSTPTAASSPTASRSALGPAPGPNRAPAAGQAGERQVPDNPKVGYTQLYGAPGTAGVSILSV